MEDAAERKKRLKVMRDEASAPVTLNYGSTSLANPLIEQPEQGPSASRVFSFYSDPLASVQARLPAPRQPQRQPPSMDHNRAAPVDSMLQPRPVTAGQQIAYAQSGPPVPQQSGLQQTWGPPPPLPPQAPQLPHHCQQAGHFSGVPFQGKGGQPYSSWQGPPPQGFHPPRPPIGLAPGIRPAGRGMSGQGPTGRGRQGQDHGPSRGRGRGRGSGRTSGGAGSSDNIEAYVSPGMLQDPWAGLMQQYQQSAPAERPKPLADNKRTLGSAAGHSMSDMFDAVEQEAQALSQGRLAEEGMQDRPWH